MCVFHRVVLLCLRSSSTATGETLAALDETSRFAKFGKSNKGHRQSSIEREWRRKSKQDIGRRQEQPRTLHAIISSIYIIFSSLTKHRTQASRSETQICCDQGRQARHPHRVQDLQDLYREDRHQEHNLAQHLLQSILRMSSQLTATADQDPVLRSW